MTRRERIRAKIYERVFIDPISCCHLWQGPTSGDTGRGAGYPRMNLDGQTVAVHIVNWTNEHGYIPGKKELDHVCRNRLCINPDNDQHVEMVTRKKNAQRREAAKRAAVAAIMNVFCEEVA